MASGWGQNLPGTNSKDFSKDVDKSVKEMKESIGTVLAVQELIRQIIRRNPSHIEAILRIPNVVDQGVWICVHLRQICMELNGLAVKLQRQCRHCQSMPTNSQSVYLCCAHEFPKDCPAMDYIEHTLNNVAYLLNSDKYFCSRIPIDKSTAKDLRIMCRKMDVIFSHAYHHHRAIFSKFEKDTHLSKRLRILCFSFLDTTLYTFINIVLN